MPFSAGSDAVIAFEGTTQIERPSPRRGEKSRAACSASVASAACSEPTCLCASPLRLRMKTSQSGMFGVAMVISLFRRLRVLALLALFGIGGRRLAHPGAVVMGLAPRRQPVAV